MKTSPFGGNRAQAVGKNETVDIGESRTETVGKNASINVGENQTITIGKNAEISVGKNLAITAGDSITIKTGDASISMKKNGDIQIKGKNITIQGSGKIMVKASRRQHQGQQDHQQLATDDRAPAQERHPVRKHHLLLMPDPDGIDSLFTVVKATLVLGERLSLAEQQIPVVALKDEYHGDPGKSSIKQPSGHQLDQAGTDVLMLGTAHAPGGRATTQMDVSLAVGPVRKTLRVLGDRVWERARTDALDLPPGAVRKMPLVWERAFGGTDRKGADLRGEARNPVGAGYRARNGEKELDGLPLPNLEDPEHLIGSWKDTAAARLLRADLRPLGASQVLRRYLRRALAETAGAVPADRL